MRYTIPMPKEKKNFTKLSIKKKQQFPHIFRISPEYIKKTVTTIHWLRRNIRRMLPLGVVAGISILFVINLYMQNNAPALYKKLLGENSNSGLFMEAYKTSVDSMLNTEIKNIVIEQRREEEISVLDVDKKKRAEKYSRIQKVVKENPEFPDGYAFLAVLEYRMKKCSIASRHINKAIELDPNRTEFSRLRQHITQCGIQIKN